MRSAQLGMLLVLVLLSVPVWGQQGSPSNAQAPPAFPPGQPAQPPQLPTGQGLALLQQALTAQTGGASINDVTMTGTATILVNPRTKATETGKIVITLAGMKNQAIISLPSTTLTETRSISNGVAAASYVGLDGSTVVIPPQSALAPHPYWFFPALVLNSALASSEYGSSYVGQETRNGASVQHIAVWRLPDGISVPITGSAQSFQYSTEHEIYLDPVTLLPESVTYFLHPYSRKNPQKVFFPYRNNPLDALEEIRYSNYQSVHGTPVAFNIEVYLNGVLVRTIQLSSVSFNTGATISGN